MSKRRSNRLQTQRTLLLGKYREDSEEPNVAGPSTEPLPMKRKRELMEDASWRLPASRAQSAGAAEDDPSRPPKRPRLKRGVLQHLVEMPLELLFDIFGKLDPIDVLNLARSTKALRAVLMSRSAAEIWREALSNIDDMPPCPPDINEPQWVDLTFGKNCQICGKADARTHQIHAWQARIRGCHSCVMNEFTRGSVGTLSELAPHYINRSQGRRSERGYYIHRKTFEALIQAEKTLTDPEEREKWFKEKKEEKEERVAHADMCADWIALCASERAQDRAEKYNQRKQALKEKLEALGYSLELIDDVFETHSFWMEAPISSCLKRGFTSRVWAGLKDEVVEVMERLRIQYIQRQRGMQSRPRFDALIGAHSVYLGKHHPSEVHGVIPPLGDIFLIPEVRDIVMAEPLPDAVDSATLEELFERMPEFGATWKQAVCQKLVDLMEPHAAALGLDTIDESSLNLAVAVFECHRCFDRQNMHLPRALVHRCFCEHSYNSPGPQTDDPDVRSFVYHSKRSPWANGGGLAFDINTALIVSTVVTAAGLDPKTATIEDMDALDPIFTMEERRYQAIPLWTWKGLLYRTDVVSSKLTLVDEDLSSVVRERLNESMRNDRASSRWSEHIYCSHCFTKKGDSKDIRAHLEVMHNIVSAKDEDVWIHPDHPKSRLSFVYHKFPGATVI